MAVESYIQPTFMWLDGMNMEIIVNTTGSVSTLTFNPLLTSHAGIYTCSVMVGDSIANRTQQINVKSMPVKIHI